MAAPVVDSVSPPVSPGISLTPGGAPVDVTIVAHDPDSGTGTGTIAITDSGGNVTNVVVNITELDPLTFGACAIAGLTGVTCVRQTAAGISPAVYRFTAA